jgi:hypothetical protein
MKRFILIRPTGSPYGGKVLEYPISELIELYSEDERAQLAKGLTVHRGDESHTDVLAFHDRHATPDRRGTVFLRRIMKRDGLAA